MKTLKFFSNTYSDILIISIISMMELHKFTLRYFALKLL